eukprot:437953-Pelagomonas_calceolata.AAC.2
MSLAAHSPRDSSKGPMYAVHCEEVEQDYGCAGDTSLPFTLDCCVEYFLWFRSWCNYESYRQLGPEVPEGVDRGLGMGTNPPSTGLPSKEEQRGCGMIEILYGLRAAVRKH